MENTTQKKIVDKLNSLKNWQVALIILVVGCAVFWSGLTSSFQGDDQLQIVNNTVVHSVSHIGLLFGGGTFYNGGGGGAPLSGVYYRPLMMTVFMVLYSVFGLHSLYFHLFQLLLGIASAFLLYLFFRYSFSVGLALFLALLFLVHPLNSQAVFAIPSMQDALLFFFGILSLYLLVRLKSSKSLVPVILCLFLALLSKESGILFVVLSGLYLLWWDRRRLLHFLEGMILPLAAWMALKISAVGLKSNPHNGPIDYLNLYHRLLNDPSIILFYISKFVFPWHLASAYYWTYTSVSLKHVLIPLFIDIVTLGLIIFVAIQLKRRSSKAHYYTYIFFSLWAIICIIPCLQIIPLDMTVCETWFYASTAGTLGMIGCALELVAWPKRISKVIVIIAMGLVLIVLGVRTGIRGDDWKNPLKLAYSDIATSNDDYNADLIIASNLASQGDSNAAKSYALRAIYIFPTASSYNVLGSVLVSQNNYAAALKAFQKSINYSQAYYVYENIAVMSLYSENPTQTSNYIIGLVDNTNLRTDGRLWFLLGLSEQLRSDNVNAKISIINASRLGYSDSYYSSLIMANKPIKLPLQPTLAN